MDEIKDSADQLDETSSELEVSLDQAVNQITGRIEEVKPEIQETFRNELAEMGEASEEVEEEINGEDIYKLDLDYFFTHTSAHQKLMIELLCRRGLCT